MKLAIRIFNGVIMALSLIATIFLFASPTLSFNSNIAVDVEALAKFVPETIYTSDIDIVRMLGTDQIQVAIKFKLGYGDMPKVIDGNKDRIDEYFIKSNVDDIVEILYEPVDIITDMSIRSIIKSTIISEIDKAIQVALTQYGSDSTPAEVRDEVGMDDEYFNNFAYALYDAANADSATLDSVTDVLFSQIDDALAMAEESGVVDTSGYTEEKKTELKNNISDILTDLKLVEGGGHLKKISHIAYIYLADYIKDALTGKVDAAILEKGYDPAQDTTDQTYCKRLIGVYVLTMMPAMLYTFVGYVTLGLFIGLFIFSGIWIALFVITLLKTLSKKPWTIFGPWFWVIGALQLILGLGLTIFGKFIFPNIKLPVNGLPLKHIIVAPRTYALVPSILFIIAIVMAIGYGFLKRRVKKEIAGEQQ